MIFSTPYQQPYVPRRYTFEVRERVYFDGEIELELDEDNVRGVLQQLKADRFEAVAVCLLWSISNPIHEQIIGRMIEEELPGIPFTLSHAVNPILREYRRASAAAVDASLKPMMQAHLTELRQDLISVGLKSEPLVSTSIGGAMQISEAIRAPIHMTKSGPSMAPVASREFAMLEYVNTNSLVCDTGGTTFDVGLVRDGELTYSQ